MNPTWTSDCGRIVLYNADCLEVLPTLTGVDAVVTDPPYGIGLEYGTYQDTIDNLRSLIHGAIIPAIHASKRGLVFCSHSMIWEFPTADWVGCVTWNTTGSYGKLGVCQWTPVLFYGKDIDGFGAVNGVIKSDTIAISGGHGVGFRREETINHPCPKPRNLMFKVLQRFTNKGESVLDLTMGSGTTGIACLRTGRKFIGIEIDKGYFTIAKERIQRELAQGVLAL